MYTKNKYGLKFNFYNNSDSCCCDKIYYSKILYISNSNFTLIKIKDNIEKNIISKISNLHLDPISFIRLLMDEIFKGSGYITKINSLYNLKVDRNTAFENVEDSFEFNPLRYYTKIIYSNLIEKENFNFLDKIYNYKLSDNRKKDKDNLFNEILPNIEKQIYSKLLSDLKNLYIDDCNTERIKEYPTDLQYLIKNIIEEKDDIIKIIVKKSIEYIINIFKNNPYGIDFLLDFINNLYINPASDKLHFYIFEYIYSEIIEIKDIRE